jgi:hypothetical protein
MARVLIYKGVRHLARIKTQHCLNFIREVVKWKCEYYGWWVLVSKCKLGPLLTNNLIFGSIGTLYPLVFAFLTMWLLFIALYYASAWLAGTESSLSRLLTFTLLLLHVKHPPLDFLWDRRAWNVVSFFSRGCTRNTVWSCFASELLSSDVSSDPLSLSEVTTLNIFAC